MEASATRKQKHVPPSTVGRAKAITAHAKGKETIWSDESTTVQLGDSLGLYGGWPEPTAIISDGAYGVLGFEGDTSDHLELPLWYEPHIRAWSTYAHPA